MARWAQLTGHWRNVKPAVALTGGCRRDALRRCQQGSQIRGTPSSGRTLGIRRCSESCVGFASVPGFSFSRSHGGRSSNVGCRWPIGAWSTARSARDDRVVAVTLASEDGSPIAGMTALTSIVASKGTMIVDGRICMALLYVFAPTKNVFALTKTWGDRVIHSIGRSYMSGVARVS